MTPRAKIFNLLLFLLFLASIFFDTQIVQFIESNRKSLLNLYMLGITDLGFFLVLSFLSTYLIVTRRYRELILVGGAIFLSLEIGYILKKLFQVPRPSELATQLTYATGYTFPSIHAAIAFAIIPFVQRLFKHKIFGYGMVLILFSIAASRTYLGVHYLSDILFGGLIGYMVAWTFLVLEQQHQIVERLVYHLGSKREIRRQVAHLITGIFIILLVKLNILTTHMLGGVLVVGGTISLLSMRMKVPIIHQILKAFERPAEMTRFPGKGSFFLVLGSFLSLLIFEEQIALAAIAIMAVGDSITTITGLYFGKLKKTLNPLKHFDGTIVAIIIGTIAAFNFVPFQQAFLASVVAMLFEVLTIKRIDRILDDNVVIPMIAGTVMNLVG